MGVELTIEQRSKYEKAMTEFLNSISEIRNGTLVGTKPGEMIFDEANTQELVKHFLSLGGTPDTINSRSLRLAYLDAKHEGKLRLSETAEQAEFKRIKSENERIVAAEAERKRVADEEAERQRTITELRQQDQDAIAARSRRAHRESYRGGVAADVITEQRAKSDQRKSSVFDGISDIQKKLEKLTSKSVDSDHRSASEIAFATRQRREAEAAGFGTNGSSGCPLTKEDITSASPAQMRTWAAQFGWTRLNLIVNS